MSERCYLVEIALDAAAYPNRDTIQRLIARLPELGTLKCFELALAPAGGGKVAFVVHDSPWNPLRDAVAAIVGSDAILRCCARPL